ncbi:hypothetical protein BsWGS_13319 [Bradybaena similaris]
MSFDNVCARMVSSGARAQILAAVILVLSCGCRGQLLKTATACYGNTNNYLRLDCPAGQMIHVLGVIHAAKLKTAQCVSPASVDTYRKECCSYHLTDCNIQVKEASSILCENTIRCDAVATWSNTNKECDQDLYPPNTNYMRMEYTCVWIDNPQANTTATTSSPPSTTTTTTTTTSTTTTSTTTTAEPTTTTTATTTTADKTTNSIRLSLPTNATWTAVHGKTSAAAGLSTHRAQQDDDQLSDAMIGAIVGGCLGMVFTFVVFIFYWGRKRRLRIVSKPQPSVWDYLLSQTFTVRGAKGYDHFSNMRSSVSSDGEPNSPVVRKNIWLPNIIDKGDRLPDDVISNYDNDSERIHRVEIHHSATPSPYAILNLHLNNLQQDTHHEA